MVDTRTLRNYLASLPGGTPASVVGGDLTLGNLTNFATAAQGALADSALQEVVPGSFIAVDATDPVRPIVGLDTDGTTAIGYAQTAVQSIVAGANIAVDNTDPRNPIVTSAGGGGGGTVSSVGLVAPTGFDVSGSPVTIAGDLTMSYTAGYQGYTTAEAAIVAAAIVDGDFGSNGLMVRTGAGAYSPRTLAAGTNITVTNGTGQAGNPTVALDAAGIASLALANTSVQAASTFATDNVVIRSDGTGRGAQATAIFVDDSDRLTIGTNDPSTFVTAMQFQVHGLDDATSGVGQFRYGANANGPNLRFMKSRAATVGGRAAVVADDLLGRLFFYGDDGTNFVNAAFIAARSRGTISTGIVAGLLDFSTATTAGVLTRRTTIDETGLLTHSFNAYIAGTIDLGNASDTTLSRSAAGRLAVEGNDVALLAVEDQVVSGGARITIKDLGNLSGASITPDPGDRPTQKITNNGAGSILPGSNYGSYRLLVINTTGASASITTTGWILKGDSFDATTTSKFLIGCDVYADMAVMNIQKVA
jgi:hypothetical protein